MSPLTLERLTPGDHLGLVVASDPPNVFLPHSPSIGTLVEPSEPIVVTIRCPHFPPSNVLETQALWVICDNKSDVICSYRLV